MSLPVAIQSAVFYVLACTPCSQARHRRKATAQAKKEKEEKADLELEQPGLYRHPSPFATNPYWKEEIDMGPSLPKKANSKNSSQRGLTSAGDSCGAPSVSALTSVGDSRVTVGGSIAALPEGDTLSEDWNRRHGYQREDEELWGQWPGNRIMDAFSKARDSAGRLIESTLGSKEVTDQERHNFYFSPKNPPVNDYHPPVVSNKAPFRDAHKWMLQPPPSAKVMEGKVPVSRAVSAASKTTSSTRTLVGEEMSLERLLHEKIAREKSRKENEPTESELIDSLFAGPGSRPLSYHRSRSLSFDGAEDHLQTLCESPRSRHYRRIGPPPAYNSEADSLTDNLSAPKISLTRPANTSLHAAQRPKLETIISTGSLRSSSRLSTRSKRTLSLQRIRSAPSPVGDDSD